MTPYGVTGHTELKHQVISIHDPDQNQSSYMKIFVSNVNKLALENNLCKMSHKIIYVEQSGL